MDNEEIWVDIPEYIGRYRVSNLGRVMAYPSKTRNDSVLKKASLTKDGYFAQSLFCGFRMKRVMYRVHRLVFYSFKGVDSKKVDRKLVINHLDGDKLNNKLSNLEECTIGQNQKHAYDIGLKNAKGERNGQAKLTNSDVEILKHLLKLGWRVGQVSSFFGVHQSTVSHIKSGKNRKTA